MKAPQKLSSTRRKANSESLVQQMRGFKIHPIISYYIIQCNGVSSKRIFGLIDKIIGNARLSETSKVEQYCLKKCQAMRVVINANLQQQKPSRGVLENTYSRNLSKIFSNTRG